MTLLINHIIDIEHLLNREGIGVREDTNEDDASTSESNFDKQILFNLKQLDKLMQLIREQIQANHLFAYELSRLDCLNERLINLNELFEFYQENKQQLGDTNQASFIRTILSRKLNSLNSVFSVRPICLDREQAELVEKNKRILRINSIHLEEDDESDTAQDLMCAIYQFDNTNLNVMKQQTQNQNQKQQKPKRSSSADNYNSTLRRRMRQTKLQNSNNLELPDTLPSVDTNVFTLSEKCISIHSFKFKSNKSTQLDELVELKPSCSHVKLIVYKLIKLKTKLLNNQFKNPVRYATVTLANSQQSVASLFETFKLELKSLQANQTRGNVRNQQQVIKKESMFKRMFVKSKQVSNSSFNTNSDLDLKTKCATLASLKSDYDSFVCFDVSQSESEKLILDLDLVSVDSLESWLQMWRAGRAKQAENFEILTVYLNKIENQLSFLDDDESFYYYIQIRLENKQNQSDDQHVNLFRSNLFKLNEDINDLCRIPFDESDLSEKQLKFDLYKLDKTDQIRLISSTVVSLHRSSLPHTSELNLGHALKFAQLRVKFAFQSKYYPARRCAADLFEFTLDNQNANLLLNLLNVYLASKKFTEPILVRKFLEFFSALNDPFALKQTRLVRDLLVEKVFDAFLRLVHDTCQSDLRFLISNLKQTHFKSANQFLINQMKSNDNEAVVKCLNKLVEIILLLSVNKSKYELKYELSDLVGKLAKLDCLNSFQFVNQLVDLYSPLELADLMITKLLPQSSLSLINRDLFQLEFFVLNYQFRNKIVSYLIRAHVDKFKLSEHTLRLVRNVFDYKQSISKQNLDDLVRLIFKQLVNSLINRLKANASKDVNLKDSFVCLFEILSLIQTTKDLIDDQDLKFLFEIIIFYLKTKLLLEDHDTQLRINFIILKFAKFIQKHLQVYQIAKLDDDDDDSLIQSYFEMLFSFVNVPNVSPTLTLHTKLKMLKIIHSFWSVSLSSQLKHSINLNEFLVTRLCKSLMSNLYFKLVEFKPSSSKPISTTSRLYLNQFISLHALGLDSCVYQFYDLCFKILADILVYNQFELSHVNEFILFNVMNWILNKESNIECRLSLCSNSSSHYESGISTASNDFELDIPFERNLSQNRMFKNFSCQIFALFDSDAALDANKRRLINSLRVCVDYNQLKDDYTYNEVSIIENLLLTCNLIKQVDDLNVTSANKLFTCQAYLNENRRQIKMYLLDDLYSLYKLDKNYLQMSLVRKQQAELIELNLNRKNESDLKEIFYLKSIKRFQINSLNESILPVAIATPSSSASASSFSSSSSSSSSSSISLALQSTTASTTNTSGIHSDDCFQTDSSVHFEVCKQLCAYYEKIDENYSKFNRILNAESKFMKPSALSQLDKSSLQLHGNLFFRIGLFGRPFKSKSIRNKYYLYKHHSYEMLSNIQNILISKLTYLNLTESNIVLLHHNQEPNASLKETKENKCYLQLCAVNRLEKSKLIELLEEMSDDKETAETRSVLTSNKYSDNEFFYYFDRPFYMRCSSNGSISTNKKSNLDTKENEAVENLWLERNVLITDEYANKFETNLTQFEEIKSVCKILLNPIRNAINDINEKTKELKQFILQYKTSNLTTNCLTQIHNLQPLTMRLLGCLDARINGGLIKYVKELLTPSLFESKAFTKKKHLFDQLYVSIRDQLDVLKIGLNVHFDMLKEANLNKKYSDESDSLNELKYHKNYEHMYQLHEHLIDCFKLIESELNQHRNSVCSLN